MSSWDRGRGIPWERIPQDSTDLEDEKEMIHRQLQREALDEQSFQPERSPASADEASTTESSQQPRFPYAHMDLLKQAAFGGCIGTITGAVFGVLDGMRAAGQSAVIKNTSDMAKARFILQGTTHKATLFGVYFGSFHVLR